MIRVILFISLSLALCSPANAWSVLGHHKIAEAAVAALSDEIPEFFRLGARAVGHSAVDPDVMKNRLTPLLRHQESPDHFMDFELLKDPHYPDLRYDLIKRLIADGENPEYVGFVPYAVVEGIERLTLAFAEHRCWPDNSSVKAKTLVYAGIVSHYAADMQQPLHTSKHYDGRLNEEGDSPHSGIHLLLDNLFENSGFVAPVEGLMPKPMMNTLLEVRQSFARSHALVDTVYELEPALRKLAEDHTWSLELRDFSNARWTASLDLLRAIYSTAWHQSSLIKLEDWIQRKGTDGKFSSCQTK